jgi:hypothetical protein
MSDGTSGARAPNPLAAVALGQSLAEAIVDTVREPLVVLDRGEPLLLPDIRGGAAEYPRPHDL